MTFASYREGTSEPGMLDGGGAILGEVGVGVLRAVAPGVLAWAKAQVTGKTVLFVGPSRAGKTSFINYLRAGTYTDPADAIARTQSSGSVGGLQLKSPNGNLQIEVKKLVDTKGQDFPEVHANLVQRHRPHALCIMMDASAEWSGAGDPDPNKNNRAWLEQFLNRLCELRADDPNVLRRLKSFSIFLNKVDKVPDENAVKSRAAQARLVVSSLLRGRANRVVDLLNVKPLSLVQDYSGGKLPAQASVTLFMPLV
jgi:hypothetical protein